MVNTPVILTRRRLVQGLTALGLAPISSRLAFGAFPLQAVIDGDPLRPRFHLMPKRGWMNDPCAPVYYRGRYHLFFQYNPNASVWGDMHWAHAVSTDMVHWTARPIALEPTPGGPDADGVFTGSMVLDHGTPTILYTCVSPSTQALATLWGSKPPEREQQCIAVPADRNGSDANSALDVWTKSPQPVLMSPPPGMQVTGFRDPVPWQEADGNYYMLLASGQKNVGGNVLLYKSADLRTWQYQHVFAQGKATGKQTDDTVDSGEMWECPDFFPLGDKHVLIHSTGTASGRRTFWQSGTLDKSTMRWTPEHEGILNHGPYYAPKTQLDAAGNRILWGWIEETRPQAEMAAAGWSGCMSLPRVLTLKNGQVQFAPAPQVNSLRSGTANQQRPGPQAELLLQMKRQTAAAPLSYVSAALRISQASSTNDVLWNDTLIAAGSDLPDAFTVRCFIDHSVVEVFLGDVIVLTQRIYGTMPAHLQLPAGFAVDDSKTYVLKSI